MSQHTPGPWNYSRMRIPPNEKDRRCGFVVNGPDKTPLSTRICDLRAPEGIDGFCEGEANARLIAAAPVQSNPIPEYAAIGELYLDPKNHRLGRNRVSPDTSQEDLLKIMREWVLDELAQSYLESGGFWTHEPLIVVEEQLYGESHLVVVEGNRRLAALKTLHDAREGRPFSSKWREMIQDSEIPEGLFERIPYVKADLRLDVQAFLGFRHVTGIKQWGADEKAGFIAKLIDESNMTYREVARKIGSKAPTVRKHYIAYRLLLQMEDEVEDFDHEKAEKRFAVLYMSIEKQGVQHYLHIDYQGDPGVNQRPVPAEHLENLAHFARWIFGTAEAECIVKDTRQIGDFGSILESEDAVAYLESEREPTFDIAFRISGGDKHEIIRYVSEASNRVELALTRAHAFKDSPELRKEVRRLGGDVRQLLSIFPAGDGGGRCRDCTTNEPLREYVKSARAVIAKARGE